MFLETRKVEENRKGGLDADVPIQIKRCSLHVKILPPQNLTSGKSPPNKGDGGCFESRRMDVENGAGVDHNSKEISQTPSRLGRFKMRWNRRLGRGAYWSVYAAWDPRTGEQAAVKVQSDRVREDVMVLEAAFLQRLKGVQGVPLLLDWGTESGLRFLALERLGPSLQELSVSVGGHFWRSTVIAIAAQLFGVLASVHRKGVLHRDVKPENLLVPPYYAERQQAIYLVDYGFAKQQLIGTNASTNGSNVARKRFVGTPLFASVAAHDGLEMGEKDDLESALYTLVHLYFGSLPWTPAENDPPSPSDPPKGADHPWFPEIARKKRDTTAAELTAGGWLPDTHPKRKRPLPVCFATAMRYVQCMGSPFGRIDHRFLVDLFEREAEQCNASSSTPRKWDWL